MKQMRLAYGSGGGGKLWLVEACQPDVSHLSKSLGAVIHSYALIQIGCYK